MDVLSDVLLAVRLTGAVFFDVDARSPFATESPGADRIGEQVMGGADRVIGFHVVTEGTCWAETVDGPDPAVRLEAGDMVIFPGGDANIMASAPGMRGAPDAAQYYRPIDRLLPFALKAGRDAGAERCRFVCGFLGCDTHPFNPLLEALPRIVRAPVSETSWHWVTRLLDAAVDATGQGIAGQEAMLAKLAELMFVEALRAHLDQLPPDARNWVAGRRDPQVGAALRLLHGRPAEPWTLQRLAREVTMSRSSFAERFTTYVGVPPMQYLVRWRLQLAARMLTADVVSVGQAASAVGYQSEAAFNRAFKREVGEAPGAWRRGRRAVTSPGP
jgi:AraC-like DNA-binding protein